MLVFKMLQNEYDKIIRLLTREIRSYYGKRLVSIVVFGSVARGTYRQDSDIDLLLIVEPLPKGRIRRVDEFLYNVENRLEEVFKKMRDKGIFIDISPVIKTPREALMGSPLFIDMVEDAKIIYDRKDFFKNILDKLRTRLDQLGAKRIWRANSWYWDLKPDYIPGDIIEL